MSIFTNSIYFGFKQWRVVCLVVLIQLIFAGILGMQFYTLLENTLGKTLEFPKLLFKYDHTVVMDFLREHGAHFHEILNQLPWLIMVWIVFSTFINAGLLSITQKMHSVSFREFFQLASSSYFSFLKINVCFVMLLLLVIVVLFFPLIINLEWLLNYLPSEKYALYLLAFTLCLLILCLIVLFIWSINSRLVFLEQKSTTLSSLRIGWKKLVDNKNSIFITLVIFLAIQLPLFYIFDKGKEVVPLIHGYGVLILFGIQQMSLFIRVLLRLMLYYNLGKINYS